MSSKLPFLALSILLLLSEPAFSTANAKSLDLRAILASSRDSNRSPGKRTADTSATAPVGQQTLPLDLVQWTRSKQVCNSTEIWQDVTRPGCQTRSIKNRICHGVCMSLYMPAAPGIREQSECEKCQPTGSPKMVNVVLQCQGNGTNNKAKQVVNVPVIEACTCSTCT